MDDLWKTYCEKGYVKLGKTLTDEELKAIQTRLYDIMDGKIQYGDKLLMQLDPGGSYSDKVQSFSGTGDNIYIFSLKINFSSFPGFEVATHDYRKIGEASCGLECDDIFLQYLRKPIFHTLMRRIYGNHAAISIYRAMVFNKPPLKGTDLPWHQDGGDWWSLDRDPLAFVWTALDPANKENGCVEVVSGSYKLGLLTKRGHTLVEEDIKKYCVEDKIEKLECEPGESWLVHNWTIHRSGTNSTAISRNAFSANYIDARTRVLSPKPPLAGPIGKPGDSFPIVWDSPFV